ncbi:MAG TPA: elongation factor G-like protein EF-G2 [Mycobacteriales bacterium]|nr:elongation factor G-like protein EF-G2 [Mycobacteriales bacterium]
MSRDPQATREGVASALGNPPPPGAIRNVVVVGHSGSGKTTLVEALLAQTGAIPRAGSVPAGTTVSDSDPVEHKQQRSVNLAVASFEHLGVRVNLLDSPGYADFVGDLRAGLRAADAALFVVSAVDGIDPRTQDLWEECAAVGMPRAVVVSKLDLPRADFDESLAVCQRVFGEEVQPLYVPLHGDDGESVAGLLGLLSLHVFESTGDGKVVERDADPEHVAAVDALRTTLIEGIISESEDETLLERWLGGETVEYKVLVADLEAAVARGHFYPVLPVCATTGLGLPNLLELLTAAFPSPLEHPLPVVTTPDGKPHAPLTCDPDGPLVAEVVKTTTDPYVGRVSIVRVFSGTLRPDVVLHVSGHGQADRGHEDHDVDEKAGSLASPMGATMRPLAACGAGDICAVTRLSRAETGDTISSPEDPMLVEAWHVPQPQLPIAITATKRSDEDKLGTALARLVAEDPTLALERNAETAQIVLWCLGEAHADVLLERLANKYGVAVEKVPVIVPMRETFTAKATGHGRHVKQSGGHGQYAVCDIEVEPLPSGSGIEFAQRVVGGSVPGQFIPSVEKGVRAQAERGSRYGYPLVDVKVTLVDGKAHSVDSSDAAFQVAGGLALKEAAAAAGVSLLEPYAAVEITVSDGDVGSVMGDLSARRGRVTGTVPCDRPGPSRTVIHAEVPVVELVRYAVDLPSLSHGTGSFVRSPLGYEAVPAHLTESLARPAS